MQKVERQLKSRMTSCKYKKTVALSHYASLYFLCNTFVLSKEPVGRYSHFGQANQVALDLWLGRKGNWRGLMDQWLTAKHGTDGKGSEGARPVKAAHWVGLSSITLEPRVRHRRQQPVPADYLPAKRQESPAPGSGKVYWRGCLVDMWGCLIDILPFSWVPHCCGALS